MQDCFVPRSDVRLAQCDIYAIIRSLSIQLIQHHEVIYFIHIIDGFIIKRVQQEFL